MARNDDGEFELVLGNRQLVSVFLIVVILLGVFFSMGYIVGRNSSGSTVADAGKGETKPIVVDNPSRTTAQTPVETPLGVPTQPEASPAAAAPSLKPSPLAPIDSRDAARGVPKREEKKTTEKKKPEVAREEPKKEKPAAPPSSEEPRSGQMFLQVVASTRADSEIVAESLARKGFKTTIAPGPNGLSRVLVGPVKDTADAAETRVRLEAAGFKPIVRKY